jgi:F-type H+-transporting ATPase subunit alpha
MEILKQPQYQPVPVANQVAVIYAVSNGYANEVPVADMQKWEASFHEYFNKSKMNLLEKIASGEWNDDVEKELKEACENFKYAG